MKKFAVFCGSAYKHIGVKLLLDGVIDYLPSPLDRPEIQVFSPSKNPQDKENIIKEIKVKITELEKSLNNLNLTNQKTEEQTDQALQTVKFEMEEKLIELRKQLKQEKKSQTVNCLDSSLPYLALAFKITKLSFGGKLTFIRVYCGKISAGT
jgi:elongation factor G